MTASDGLEVATPTDAVEVAGDVITVAAPLALVRVVPARIARVGRDRLARVAGSGEARAEQKSSSASTATACCRQSPSSSVVLAARQP